MTESTARDPGSALAAEGDGPVAAAFRGKRIVLTGFTGFLGKVFLALLLHEVPSIGRVTLLIRRKGRADRAVRRFERAVDTSPVFRPLRRLRGTELPDWLVDRVAVLDADVEKPGCELSAEQLAALGGTDLVIHCAGLTDFEPDPLRAVAVNVAGAQHVADLGARLGAPVMHISTAYVAGIGSRTVPESIEVGMSPSGIRFSPAAELRSLQLSCRTAGDDVAARIAAANARAAALGWANIYTYSKALAEHAIAERGHVTIVRPTIVECARTFPFPGWNEGINTAGPLAWLITTAFRRLPTAPDHAFDVIPVDDVARGMLLIGAEMLAGRGQGVFQLGSSDHNPMTFGRCVELTGLGHRKWTRAHGTAWDRWMMRHLDPVPAPEEADGGLGLGAAPELLEAAGEALAWVDRQRSRWGAVGEWLAPQVEAGQRRVSAWTSDVDRITRMLRLYRPFIYDNGYVFRTDRVRALPSDPAVRWEVGQLDWCDYWVNIEYPGLRTWCMPLLERRRPPTDPLPRQPFRLPERVTA
jgi:long-chain acyl-CoA synthetase